MTRTIGLVTTLVPYHHARWHAFAGKSKAPCKVIELTDKDEFPVMELPPQMGSSFERVSLFPRQGVEKLTSQAIAKKIAHTLDQLKPGCVCLNGYATPLALGALSWCQKNRVPAVLMSESTAWDEPRTGAKEWIKSRLVRLCSSALVGGVPHRDYLAGLGLERKRVSMGYDVVDNEYFKLGATHARDQAASLRKEHDLPEKYFLACARFVAKKNLPRLIEAYAHYRKKLLPTAVPWDLVILGDGVEKKVLESTRTRLALEGSVHFPGAKSYGELPVYYGLASGFIHASTTEQWGLVVNEAMASGLPVLVSHRCGCAQDLVQDGVNGFTFDPYQIEDMAEKMLRLTTNADLAYGLGKAGLTAIDHWSPQRFAEGLTLAVDTALSTTPPSGTWFDQILLELLLRR